MEHRATGYSANMMMLGMEVFQPIDILMRTAGEHFRDENPAGYVQHLRQVLRDVHSLASKKLRTQLNCQKRYYDLKLEEITMKLVTLCIDLMGLPSWEKAKS